MHRDYSVNHEGWFLWLFKSLHLHSKVLEVGSENGSLWSQNLSKVPTDLSIIVSDISAEMVTDAEEEIGQPPEFQYQVIDVQKIPYPDNSFDLVIANHCDDIAKALEEIKRALKPGGCLICSTYSKDHMHEITDH